MRHARVGAQADDRCCVGAALVDRDLLGRALQVDGAFVETPRCSEITVLAQREVDRVAGAVHRPYRDFHLRLTLA